MHNYDGLNADVTERIIGCAIEVHRHLGPGLLESVYESALCLELESAGLTFTRQAGVPVSNVVVVEVKSVERFNSVFVAQMLTYLEITGLRVGLILNFNRAVMKDGIRRIIL